MNQIKVSVITLSWDHRDFTEAFVNSIRAHTTVPYELIIVDNGSKAETQDWVRKVADKAIIFETNQGFPKGFNAGIAVAKGEYIMLANNDTEFPAGWAEKLIETMEQNPKAGIVSPVYTSGRKSALRFEAGTRIITLGKFRKYPSGVAFFMRRREMNEVFGGWAEDYAVASGEDADLCFTVWHKGYDILVDERVLIIHEGKVTSGTKLENWRSHFKKNSKQFRDRWFYYFYFPYLARITNPVRLFLKGNQV